MKKKPARTKTLPQAEKVREPARERSGVVERAGIPGAAGAGRPGHLSSAPAIAAGRLHQTQPGMQAD